MRTLVPLVPLVRAAIALALCAGPVCAVAGPDPTRDYEKKRRDVLLEAGKRHLDLGIWCRDRGLIPQATTEFMQAVEASERQHPGANIVLSYMRRLDGAFWKKRKPSRSALSSYDGKARKARLEDQEEWLDLANWAYGKKLEQEAHRDIAAVLRALDEPLEFDSKGRLVLEAGRVRSELSERFRDEAVSINGLLYLRDGVLLHLPDIDAVCEYSSDVLRVRSVLAPGIVEDLHGIGSALLATLADELDGSATYRLKAFVFADRASYDAYLDAAGFGAHKAASGLADGGTATALVCGEGLDGDDLRGLLLHELTHLASYAVNRAVMPSWYAEGLAETYGGQGTFTWDGETLAPGGPMAGHRFEGFATAPAPELREFLAADALELLRTDLEVAARFYARAWAFVRFLREGAEPDVRDKFADWERFCRGAALGAAVGDPRSRNTQPAAELFLEMLGEDLGEVERGFREYLGTL